MLGVCFTLVAMGLLTIVFISPWFHRQTPVEVAVIEILDRNAPAEWEYFSASKEGCFAAVSLPEVKRNSAVYVPHERAADRKYTFAKHNNAWYGHQLKVYAEDVDKQTVWAEVGDCIKLLKEAAPAQIAENLSKSEKAARLEAANLASYGK